MLATDDGCEGRFQRALKWAARTQQPFEQARTELCFGERLSRAGRRQKGREFLAGALETFEALGSEPWAARAREALAEIDGTVHRRDGRHSRLHRARLSFDRPHTAAQTA